MDVREQLAEVVMAIGFSDPSLYAKAMSGRAALTLGKNGEHVGQGPTFGRIEPFVQLLDNADAQW